MKLHHLLNAAIRITLRKKVVALIALGSLALGYYSISPIVAFAADNTKDQKGALQTNSDAIQSGKLFFTQEYKCYACHGYNAQTGLKRLLPLQYPEEAFIYFVKNSPGPLMPGYPTIPDDHLSDIFAYINTIPIDAPEMRNTPPLNDIAKRKKRVTN